MTNEYGNERNFCFIIRARGETYVCGHPSNPTLPLRNVKVRIAEPSIPVRGRAAPRPLGHVVIQMDVNALLTELRRNSIEDLDTSIHQLPSIYPPPTTTKPTKEKTHLRPRNILP